jgi:hypothetical protein
MFIDEDIDERREYINKVFMQKFLGYGIWGLGLFKF